MTKEQTMSALRTRMIEDMKLAGLSAKTQEVYLQVVIALVKHFGNRSPDQLTGGSPPLPAGGTREERARNL
jgi:hypothetical protein